MNSELCPHIAGVITSARSSQPSLASVKGGRPLAPSGVSDAITMSAPSPSMVVIGPDGQLWQTLAAFSRHVLSPVHESQIAQQNLRATVARKLLNAQGFPRCGGPPG